MQIFNTLTRQKEEFKPMEEGHYKMYVCGPTVYNYIHIGNARPAVVFDVMRRFLKYMGNDVKFVSNITDIDDKIMNLEQQISETNNLIYKIINHLDITSDEYSVLELKYIYSLSEYDIRDTKEISRSKYYSLLATAVSQLLEIEEVLKIVGIEGVES